MGRLGPPKKKKYCQNQNSNSLPATLFLLNLPCPALLSPELFTQQRIHVKRGSDAKKFFKHEKH